MHIFLHCKSISCFEQLLDGKLCISLYEFISQHNMCGLVGIRKKYPKIKEGNEMHHSCLWELCNYSKSLMSYDFLVPPTFFNTGLQMLNIDTLQSILYLIYLWDQQKLFKNDRLYHFVRICNYITIRILSFWPVS